MTIHTLINSISHVYPYIITIIIFLIGFYITITEHNLIKKIIGFNLIQSALIIFYIALSKIAGGKPPIYNADPNTIYSNPLPHVLMLTAIVVGIATTSLACALVVKIYNQYNTINDKEIETIENNKNNL